MTVVMIECFRTTRGTIRSSTLKPVRFDGDHSSLITIGGGVGDAVLVVEKVSPDRLRAHTAKEAELIVSYGDIDVQTLDRSSGRSMFIFRHEISAPYTVLYTLYT